MTFVSIQSRERTGRYTFRWRLRAAGPAGSRPQPFSKRPRSAHRGAHDSPVVTLARKFDSPTAPAFHSGLGVSAEYGFNRASLDEELQTLEVRPIIDRRDGRLSLILNPGLELVMRGSDNGLDPSFDVSARAGWSLSPRLSISGEYFSKPAATRHLDVEKTAHHLLFSGIDVAVSDDWEVNLGAGHCVTSHEPWVFRSVLSFRFAN